MTLQDGSTSQHPVAMPCAVRCSPIYEKQQQNTKVSALESLNGRSMFFLQPPYSAELHNLC